LALLTRLQAGKDSVSSGQVKKALLMKAGQLLAPDAFMNVLESESANKGSPLCFFFFL